MAEELMTKDEELEIPLTSDSDVSDDSGADSVDSVLEDAFLHEEDAALDCDDRDLSTNTSSTKRKSMWLGKASLDGWHGPEDIDQEPRRFHFCPRRTPGVQLDLHTDYSPLDIFQLFFTKDVVHNLCVNTNRYAESKHTQGSEQTWVRVDPDEMLRFISLIIYTGLVQASKTRDMWRTDRLYNPPFPPSVMSGSRFAAISRFLHMSDPDDDQVNEQLRDTDQYDPLCRLKPLQDNIKAACMALYQPFCNLNIDERVKQCSMGKPTKQSFRLFVLADSFTGYTCSFTVHQGKRLSQSDKGFSFDTVVELLQVHAIGTGYNLFVDNFYTSPSLFVHLHSMNTGACGIIWENRIGFPKNRSNALPRNAKRGDMRWTREGPLLFVKWKGTREVTMCSSIHRAFSGKVVQPKEKKRQGRWPKLPVPVPDPVIEYKKFMGEGDAIKNLFFVAKKTMKWYQKCFYHFVDIAVTNGYIISKEMARAKKTVPLTHEEFRNRLCVQLSVCGKEAGPASAAIPAPRAGPAPKGMSMPEAMPAPEAGPAPEAMSVPNAVPAPEAGPAPEAMPLPGACPPPEAGPAPEPKKELDCLPVAITDVGKADSRDKATVGRKYCIYCKKHKTIYKCRKCDVPLCIVVERICYTEWHNLKKKNPSND